MLLAALNELIDWCECTQNELTTKRKSLKPDLSFISKEMNANKVSNNNETECVCEREKKRKERREERGERREERIGVECKRKLVCLSLRFLYIISFSSSRRTNNRERERENRRSSMF